MDDNRYNSEFWDWVEANRDKDPTTLRLKMRGKSEWIDDAICQIENIKKSRKKFQLDSNYSDALPRLMPVAISVEQATSAQIALFHRDIAMNLMPNERLVLDMTCGLGVDTALLSTIPNCRVTSIEKDEKIAIIAQENFKSNPDVTILNTDSVKYLEKTSQHFNLLFIDPARRDNAGQRVFNIRDCSPNICEILPVMKSKSDAIMIKLSPMLDITQTIKDLPGVREIYIIEQNGECREILAVFHDKDTEEPTIHVRNNGSQFSFTKTSEEAAQESYLLPAKNMILIEPSAAMMKAAPFKLIAEKYGIDAIHPNTHLYLSQNFLPEFMGRQNRIIEVLPFSSGNLKRLSRLHLAADVAVRNFPMSAEQLRQRLGIKKSGEERIMGITAIDGKQYIIRLGKHTHSS